MRPDPPVGALPTPTGEAVATTARGPIGMLAATALAIALLAFGLVACSPFGGSLSLDPELTEPVTLSSSDGVLEVQLHAAQASTTFNTVADPVKNLLLYDYRIIHGTSSNGVSIGKGTYPAPTLAVQPGDKLIIHLANGLTNLTINDLTDPALTPVGQPVPLTPKVATDLPTNLHTHGLHVSPQGNSDNVLLDLPQGQTNRYEFDIPADHPQGLYWYHPHRHMLTEAMVARGLAGMLTIGNPAGNIAKVAQNNLPVRPMALQVNWVFDRQGGQSTLANTVWSRLVNLQNQPTESQLADGSYRPLLAPPAIEDSPPGTTYKSNWSSGTANGDAGRGAFQFVPQNLQSFTPANPGPADPADPSLPDHLRDVQYTVNGQFQPVVKSRPGQTEIWALANIDSQAYINVAVRNTATGQLVPLRVVARDGNPTPSVGTGMNADGTTYLLPSAARVALAVTMPEQGGLQLEMPPVSGADANSTQSLSGPGIRYRVNDDGAPTAQLGELSMAPEHVSWLDGFKVFPTQVLLRAQPQGEPATPVSFTPGEKLVDDTSFVDTQNLPVDVSRTLLIDGAPDPQYVNPADPNGFLYRFQGATFPNTPTLHPRLGSVEEWNFVNRDTDQHPIHIHVNDFQVTRVDNPVAGTSSGPQEDGYDTYNIPAPSLTGPDGQVVSPGQMSLRTKFQDFTGTYVMHCHRLDHEDYGLMLTVNVIPAVSTYAVLNRGPEGRAVIDVRDQADDRVVAHVTTSPGAGSATMADIDGDQILDLVVGAAAGQPPEVVVYSGAGTTPFATELARFQAFESDFRGGVTVAADHLDGNPTKGNIVVGSGPGRPSEIKVFSSQLGQLGSAPAVLASFEPSGDTGGVRIATGLTDLMGRPSIITAPTTGSHVKVFRFDLFTAGAQGTPTTGHSHQSPQVQATSSIGAPALVTEFDAFDDYDGPLSLATGWIAEGQGGAESIVVGQREGAGVVRTFSSGSRLDGASSPVYVQSLHDQMVVRFAPTLTFRPFQSGVSVATTSTTQGAKLLVSGSDQQGAASTAQFFAVRDGDAPNLVVQPVGVPIPNAAPGAEVGGD